METSAKFLALIGLIRDYRIMRGLTQTDMAQLIHMHKTYYWRVEQGERLLRKDELDTVCAVLGINRDALLREAGYTAIGKESPK